jgi:hypothetical protein
MGPVDVFVSYSRADLRHAAEIDSFLRAKGLRTFVDRRDLAPGLLWVRALEQAIDAAKAVIVLIGPRGLGNTQQYERDLALIRQTREPAFPVVPVILPKTRKTGEDEGQRSSTKHPPATFQMVLDGQQRVQSLLLAFGGDGWGFKLPDRQWHEQLSGTKPRGPRGRPHWSLGCLCH